MNRRISGLIDTLTVAEEDALQDHDNAEAMVIRTALTILEAHVLDEQHRARRLQALIDRAECELIAVELVTDGDTRRQEGAAS
jgi:hypothetical protein